MKKRTLDTETRVEAAGPALNKDGDPVAVLPVVEEEVHVSKRQRVTGKVRVTKSVRDEEVLVDEPLKKERVEVDRVPVNRLVDEMPGPRQEGDILIIPVVEEVMVKHLLLKEEIRVKRVQEEHREPQKVVLRREEINVDRSPGEGPKRER